jgi:hypothetical protein
MFGVAAVFAFAIALLMYLFGWGSGKVSVDLFTLIGFVCLAAHVTWGWWGPLRRHPAA